MRFVPIKSDRRQLMFRQTPDGCERRSDNTGPVFCGGCLAALNPGPKLMHLSRIVSSLYFIARTNFSRNFVRLYVQ
jgi:hypothetical protein